MSRIRRSNVLFGNADTRRKLERHLASKEETLKDFFTMNENQVRTTLADIDLSSSTVARIGMCVCSGACVCGHVTHHLARILQSIT